MKDIRTTFRYIFIAVSISMLWFGIGYEAREISSSYFATSIIFILLAIYLKLPSRKD